MPRSALVAGATGLVGRDIVRALTADGGVSEIRVLVRRAFDRPVRDPKVREIVADFEALGAQRDGFRVDQVFCALGSTIRNAGSQDAFRHVDFDYPFEIARLAHREGARHFLLVSAVGASARSRLFYNRVKGELEEAIGAVGFASVTIARPSLLLGDRDEPRLGEQVMKRVAFLLPSPWKPVQARQVASALVAAARRERPGLEILDNVALRREPPADS